MDPVHSWQALLNVLGAQEARTTGYKRHGAVTPLTAVHPKAVNAAATPYYTPAPLSPGTGIPVTPVDAWYSIISSLKGGSNGGHGSPNGISSRLSGSASGSPHGSSPGTVRQQLFQTAAKSSRQGSKTSRLQQQTSPIAISASSAAARDAVRTPKAVNGSDNSVALLPASSPQQLQQTAVKNQQLAAKLDDLRASAASLKPAETSPGGAGGVAGAASSSRATAQRLHAAGVGGLGTSSKQGATPLSRRLFASPSKQAAEAVTPVPFAAPAVRAVTGAASPITEIAANGNMQQVQQAATSVQAKQQDQQQKPQLVDVLSQMEELLQAVKQQQGIASKLQQEQVQQIEAPADPVQRLNELVQQVAATVKPQPLRHEQKQQTGQTPGTITTPNGLLVSAAVEHTPAPPQSVTTAAAELLKQQQTMLQLLLQQQQQLLEQQQQGSMAQTSETAAGQTAVAAPIAAAATAGAAVTLSSPTGRVSPSSKRAGVVIPRLMLPASVPHNSVLLKRSSTWSGAQPAADQQQDTAVVVAFGDAGEPVSKLKVLRHSTTQQGTTGAVSSFSHKQSSPDSSPGSSRAAPKVAFGRTLSSSSSQHDHSAPQAAPQQRQQSPPSSPGSRSPKVAFGRTVSAILRTSSSRKASPGQPRSPGSSQAGARRFSSSNGTSGSPKPNAKPPSGGSSRQASPPESPGGGSRTRVSGSYAEKFLQQKALQQEWPVSSASPKLRRSSTTGATTAAIPGTASRAPSGSEKGDKPLRRQWTVPSRIAVRQASADDADVVQEGGGVSQQGKEQQAGQDSGNTSMRQTPPASRRASSSLEVPAADAGQHPGLATDEGSQLATVPAETASAGREASSMQQLTAKFQALDRDWQSMSAVSSGRKGSPAGAGVSRPHRAATAPTFDGQGAAGSAVAESHARSAPGLRKSLTFAAHSTFTAAAAEQLLAAVEQAFAPASNATDTAADAAEGLEDGVSSMSSSGLSSVTPQRVEFAETSDLQQPRLQAVSNSAAIIATAESGSLVASPEESDNPAARPAAVGVPLPGLATPSTPPAALPRVHTPGKAPAEAAADTATPMLANSTAAVINLSEAWREESENTHSRWKQLLDEWSADDLLTAHTESSTNLLPSDSSAMALVATIDAQTGVPAAFCSTEPDSLAAGAAYEEPSSSGVEPFAAVAADLQHQQQPQEQQQQAVPDASPLHTATPAADSLFIPVSFNGSEASEMSLSALTTKAATQQQQQQQQQQQMLRRAEQQPVASPDIAADALTARQLFTDDGTPMRSAAASAGPTQQQTQQIVQESQDQSGVTHQLVQQGKVPTGLGAAGRFSKLDSFEQLLVNLRGVHDQLEAERRSWSGHGGRQPPPQHETATAATSQLPRGFAEQPAASLTADGMLLGPKPAAAAVLDASISAPGSLGAPAQTAPSLIPQDAVVASTIPSTGSLGAAASRMGTAAGAAVGGTASTAGQDTAGLDTEDSFNQLLAGLQDVHDRLAAERQHQQLQQQRRKQQDQAVETEDSFNKLLDSLRDVHDKLAAERQRQQRWVAAPRTDSQTQASAAAAAAAISAAADGQFAVDNLEAVPGIASSSNSHAVPPRRQGPVVMRPSTAASPADAAATFQEAAALAAAARADSAAAAEGHSSLRPSMVRQAAAAAAAARAGSVSPPIRPALGQPTAVAASAAADGKYGDSNGSRAAAVQRQTSADDRFSVLRQKLQQSRAMLQSIGISTPAATAQGAATGPQNARPSAEASRNVSPLSLPASGWLKATPLQQYLKRTSSQQGQAAGAVAPAGGSNGNSQQQAGSQIQALVDRWRAEAAVKSQAAAGPTDALLQQQKATPLSAGGYSGSSFNPAAALTPDAAFTSGPEQYSTPWQHAEQSSMNGSGLSPLSPLHTVSQVSAFDGVGLNSSADSHRTPTASLAAARTPEPAAAGARQPLSFGSPLVGAYADIPGPGAATAAAPTAAVAPLDVLFPMSPLLSSSTGVANSSAGTAAAAQAAAQASSALALAAAAGSGLGSKRGSQLATPSSIHSRGGSAQSIASSPPSVNMLQRWVRHGSPTKQLKQQLRSRAWQEQQLQLQQQQHELRGQMDVAQEVVRDLDRSQAVMQAAARGNSPFWGSRQQRHQHGQQLQYFDISGAAADQTPATFQPWAVADVLSSADVLGSAARSPAEVLAATAAVAESTAAALAVAAATSSTTRSVSPNSRLKGFRMQQAAAVNDQHLRVTAQQLLSRALASPAAAATGAVVTPRHIAQQYSTPNSSRTNTWLETAAYKRRQQQSTLGPSARLETAAAGLADMRRQLAATGVARGNSSVGRVGTPGSSGVTNSTPIGRLGNGR